MIVVLELAIGADVFFKSPIVLVTHKLLFFSWLLAAFAVISISLTLIEIDSARNRIYQLFVVFNNNYIIYKACKKLYVLC